MKLWDLWKKWQASIALQHKRLDEKRRDRTPMLWTQHRQRVFIVETLEAQANWERTNGYMYTALDYENTATQLRQRWGLAIPASPSNGLDQMLEFVEDPPEHP